MKKMHRHLGRSLLAAAAIGILGSAYSADAALIEFAFPITVSQENPAPDIVPPTNVEPSGVGFVTLETDTNFLTWEIVYAGLSGPIVAPGAHIHGPAPIGSNAGILVDLAGNPGAGLDPDGGTVPLPQPASGTLTGTVTVTDAMETAILDGLTYVNIHTERNPSGEIRGQIVNVPIPEPTTLSAIAAGGLLFLRRRRP